MGQGGRVGGRREGREHRLVGEGQRLATSCTLGARKADERAAMRVGGRAQLASAAAARRLQVTSLTPCPHLTHPPNLVLLQAHARQDGGLGVGQRRGQAAREVGVCQRGDQVQNEVVIHQAARVGLHSGVGGWVGVGRGGGGGGGTGHQETEATRLAA